jgi:hypothetical protein
LVEGDQADSPALVIGGKKVALGAGVENHPSRNKSQELPA